MQDTQPKRTYTALKAIIDEVKYQDFHFRLLEKGDGFLLQAEFYAKDSLTGKLELQRGRKWYLSPYSTESEVVETVFKCIRIAQDHEVKENFRYRGYTVYNPHFNVYARIDICRKKGFDQRIPPVPELAPDPEE